MLNYISGIFLTFLAICNLQSLVPPPLIALFIKLSILVTAFLIT